MISMSLSKAAKAIESKYDGEDIMFSGCSIDSRTIEKGNLFIAINGENFDGHDYVSMAEEKGATALLLEREVNHEKPLLKVGDTTKSDGLVSKSLA